MPLARLEMMQIGKYAAIFVIIMNNCFKVANKKTNKQKEYGN